MTNNEQRISFWHPASLLCTCFGIGKIPFAPGTWGSLFGVGYVLLWLEFLPNMFGAGLVFLDIICGFFIGWWCSNIYEGKSGKHDSSEIVIDEWVGQALTFVIFFLIIEKTPAMENITILFIAINFITFRFFDILKPFPISWVDKNVKGGLGVMLDDVLAGIAAGITSALIFLLIINVMPSL